MDNPAQGIQDEEKQNKSETIYVGHQYTQTNTNNVNKTRVLLQTTGGTDTQSDSTKNKTDEHSWQW